MSIEPINMRAEPDRQAAERRSFDRDAVSAMVADHHGWHVVEREANKRRDQLTGEILSGKLTDADRYASYTGELRGIEWVLDTARRIAETGQAEEAPSGDTRD